MRNRTGWIVIALTALAEAPPATGPVPAGHTLRVFTPADATAALAAAPLGPDWTATVTPLYGGSDPSAFKVAVAAGADAGNADTVVPLLDVPIPTDLRPGDAVVGRLWALGHTTTEPPTVEVSTAGGDGGRTPGGPTAIVPTNSDGLTPTPDFRLPVAFDPAHRPIRMRLRVRLPHANGFGAENAVAAVGLRLVHGDGPPVAPATRPTGVPSPAWPPVGQAPTTVHTFGGNDVDPHVTSWIKGDDLNPVVLLGDTGAANAPLPVTVAARFDPADGPVRTVPVLAMDEPGVTADRFAVTGTVAYSGVTNVLGNADADALTGFAYLQLTADFADGPPAVVRTLADSGVLRVLRGRSGDRPFALPVDAPGRHLTRVRLDVAFAGHGRVTLSDLKLVQLTPAPTAAAAAAAAPPPWWSRDAATGTAVGLVGLLGLLAFAEPLIRRGRGRPLVVGGMVGAAVVAQAYFGWAMLLAGRGEAASTWVPLLACAAASGCVPLALPAVRRRYRDAELRRMRAMDAVAAV